MAWRERFFTCAVCRNTYEKGWPDEDAADELADTFGQPRRADDDVTCDDCYEAIVAWGKALPFGHPMRLDPRG